MRTWTQTTTTTSLNPACILCSQARSACGLRHGLKAQFFVVSSSNLLLEFATRCTPKSRKTQTTKHTSGAQSERGSEKAREARARARAQRRIAQPRGRANPIPPPRFQAEFIHNIHSSQFFIHPHNIFHLKSPARWMKSHRSVNNSFLLSSTYPFVIGSVDNAYNPFLSNHRHGNVSHPH